MCLLYTYIFMIMWSNDFNRAPSLWSKLWFIWTLWVVKINLDNQISVDLWRIGVVGVKSSVNWKINVFKLGDYMFFFYNTKHSYFENFQQLYGTTQRSTISLRWDVFWSVSADKLRMAQTDTRYMKFLIISALYKRMLSLITINKTTRPFPHFECTCDIFIR